MSDAAIQSSLQGSRINSRYYDRKSRIHSVSSVEPKLRAALYDDNNAFVSEKMGFIEKIFGVRREYIAYVIVIVVSLYLMSGEEAGLLCNLIGATHPIVISFKVICNQDKTDAITWLLPFWIQYSALLLIDSYEYYIMKVFPIYWLVKAIILLYLLLPQTNGTRRVHRKLILPTYTITKQAIDNKMR
ncbi:unnamed protein product [Anisakis simplex]|uniref:Receptor expression-enhancing protein n=1 Tax=Anisakis simplex TaxID=6269 RepID=A0A0M3J3D6_ANISI|nr:unnamed protein product [Anisakis simplex]